MHLQGRIFHTNFHAYDWFWKWFGGSGATFTLSKYLGEGNKQKADNASAHAITINIIVSLIMNLILLIFLIPILNLICVGHTIGYAMDKEVII